jgi:DNA-binding CsgD family transcriptional regulator
MISKWKHLLSHLGLTRESSPRFFEMEASMYTALVDLANQQQRSAEEVQADLLAAGLAECQTHEELCQRWLVLSPREQEVTAFTCLGYTNRQIAAKLHISPDTVKGYVQHVLIKFHLHSKNELRMHLALWDFSKWGPKAQS